MSTAAERAKVEADVAEVFAYLKRYGITRDELINIGSEDLNSPDVGLVAKAQRVEKCWSLVAELKLVFADLEGAAGQSYVERPQRRRGERSSPKTLSDQAFSTSDPRSPKFLKNNNNRDNHLVEGLQNGRWQHKRRLSAPNRPCHQGAVR
jgi:hypothetical protein